MIFEPFARTTIMDTQEIVTTDNVHLNLSLKNNDNPLNIDLSATVQASVISLDHKTEIISAVSCTNDADGADWPNGKVAVVFSSSNTDVETYGPARLMLKITESGETTSYFGTVVLIRGATE